MTYRDYYGLEGDRYRMTGPRRELAVCYECGEDVVQPSSFDPTCGETACRERWVLRQPVTTKRAGEETGR